MVSGAKSFIIKIPIMYGGLLDQYPKVMYKYQKIIAKNKIMVLNRDLIDYVFIFNHIHTYITPQMMKMMMVSFFVLAASNAQ